MNKTKILTDKISKIDNEIEELEKAKTDAEEQLRILEFPKLLNIAKRNSDYPVFIIEGESFNMEYVKFDRFTEYLRISLPASFMKEFYNLIDNALKSKISK